MSDLVIMPGIGLGPIHFGMSANEVEEILGRADDAVLYDEHVDRSLDLSFKEGLSCSFHQSDDFRLCSMEVERLYPCTLFGKSIDSFSLQQVEPAFRAANIAEDDLNHSTMIRDEEIEEISWAFHRLGMTLYFDLSETLQSVSWGVLFDSNDNIVWPSKRTTLSVNADTGLEQLLLTEMTRPLTPTELLTKGRYIQLSATGESTLVDAEQAFLKALELDAEYVPALLELGWYYHAVEDSPSQASPLFEKAYHLALDQLREAIKGRTECMEELSQDSSVDSESLIQVACRELASPI